MGVGAWGQEKDVVSINNHLSLRLGGRMRKKCGESERGTKPELFALKKRGLPEVLWSGSGSGRTRGKVKRLNITKA